MEENYNEEPVYYCGDCLSLGVKSVSVGNDLLYCDKCGSTDIKVTSIEEWEVLYKEKYGVKFLNR